MTAQDRRPAAAFMAALAASVALLLGELSGALGALVGIAAPCTGHVYARGCAR
jgi:hypothetical protein